jgi:hypothetical protein
MVDALASGASGSNPVEVQVFLPVPLLFAHMAELVYALP